MLNDKFVNRALQLFIRFLKEEEIIEVFKKNYLMYVKQHDKQRYVKYCSSYSSYVFDAAHIHSLYNEDIHCLFLDYAMTWYDTEKGFRFWLQINVKWRTYFFNNLELIKKEINEK